MIIKVCGMKHPSNMKEVINLGADWIGMIFYPQSPRYILSDDNEPEKLNEISGVRRVGVFVNESTSNILHYHKLYQLDMIQLHGAESPEMCSAIRSKGIEVIKAFSVSRKEDFEKHLPYSGTCDYYLFDTKCDSHGGSGVCFDWSLLDHYKGDTPFLLSGGIHPDSANQIKEIKHPKLIGIDLNSRFEAMPGIKDITLLKPFINQLKEI